ncbi:MAG TPA: hypothetical protein VFU21_04750 [Kofleriaceae bacterium]|nr:hypothetical protein [Kofleriaceae bacterium]
MRLSNLILSLLMTLTITSLACATDSGDDPPGPVEDGDGDDGDGDDGDGDGGGDEGGDGGDDPGGAPDGGNQEEACASPGAVGNAGGVGEYCTPGGGECDDNDAATYCTVDYQSDAPPFCTMPCFGAGDCGADSTCTSDGGGPLMGCVPLCVTEGGA